MKSFIYYFYFKTKILADFQTCISVPLKVIITLHFLHVLFPYFGANEA